MWIHEHNFKELNFQEKFTATAFRRALGDPNKSPTRRRLGPLWLRQPCPRGISEWALDRNYFQLDYRPAVNLPKNLTLKQLKGTIKSMRKAAITAPSTVGTPEK